MNAIVRHLERVSTERLMLYLATACVGGPLTLIAIAVLLIKYGGISK